MVSEAHTLFLQKEHNNSFKQLLNKENFIYKIKQMSLYQP